jgi:tetratricopeptide (TPR) repeat protein
LQALIVTGRYAEALPLAKKLVEAADPDAVGERDLPAALNDLGAVQFRLGHLADAEASYLRSLDLLEGSQGISSQRFVIPLAGLASVYAAQNRHELAIDFYRQALTVNRRGQGLFNTWQIGLVEALSSSYVAIGNYPAAEAERRYLVQIAARNYGADDPRILPALAELARWNESMENFAGARLLYHRIYDIAGKEGGDNNNPAQIDALLGVGRTHRLQFIKNPESAAIPYATINQVTQVPLPGLLWQKQRDFNPLKMNRDGFKSLQKALRTLERQDDPPAQLLGRTLVEIGDWHLTARQPDVAVKHYARAAAVFTAVVKDGETHPLAAPRLVVYRPPAAAVNHRWLPHAEVIAREARFNLTVNEKGETRDVVPSGTNSMTSMQTYQLQEALEGALYSPRFDGALPVATTGVEYTGQWFDRIPAKLPDPEAAATGSN